jgi:hypothetical protein
VTNDLDVCYSGEASNLEMMATALRELEARLRGAPVDLPFIIDARTLRNGDTFTFETVAGAFDIARTPAGTSGFAELAATAQNVALEEDLTVAVASLDDLMRMKRAAGRPKDRIELEVLAALKEELERS